MSRKVRDSMIYVVSTGRAGSMAMARLLSMTGRCRCFHEPAPKLIREAAAYCHEGKNEDVLAGILRRTRANGDRSENYAESSQTLSLIIPVLSGVFPEARFVWLMRDGRDFIASAYQKQWYSGHSENYNRYEDSPSAEKEWIDGRIRGDLAGCVSPKTWRSMSRFEKCCWYWNFVMTRTGHDLSRCCNGKYFSIQLENLECDFRKFLLWMGWEVWWMPKPRVYNAARRTPYRWNDWTEEERTIFTRWCSAQMDRHYPSWKDETGRWQETSGVRSAQSPESWYGYERVVGSVNRLKNWLAGSWK